MRNGLIKLFALSVLSSVALADLPQNLEISGGALFLAPQSNNLKYSVFVSGNQPYSQSWHYQEVKPNYSPAFELGMGYIIPETVYRYSIDWLHLSTQDSSAKQASQDTDPFTVEFVAPPYDVGPAVFGIKRATSTVEFGFDSIELNVGRIFEYCPNITAIVFGGINVLRIDQTINTRFSDFAGMPPSGITYGLPADPSFYFNTKNTSDYLGAGPDLGVKARYVMDNGFGITGKFLTAITAGRISVADNFTSASQRLAAVGITTSHQQITTPDITQVVAGFDGKLGLLYDYNWDNYFAFTLEVGYRVAYYINAISQVSPASLVQPGLNFVIPEFATGTMAINTTETRNRPFTFNGAYINLRVITL